MASFPGPRVIHPPVGFPTSTPETDRDRSRYHGDGLGHNIAPMARNLPLIVHMQRRGVLAKGWQARVPRPSPSLPLAVERPRAKRQAGKTLGTLLPALLLFDGTMVALTRWSGDSALGGMGGMGENGREWESHLVIYLARYLAIYSSSPLVQVPCKGEVRR